MSGGLRWILIGCLVGILATVLLRPPARAADDGASERVDAIVEAAMTRSHTTGLSLAIAEHGRIVLTKAYGTAARGVTLRPTHRFRFAHVSAPMTAIEVMRLVEHGKLRLDQRVIGPGALLGDLPSADPRVREITVQHLLEHTAGGWAAETGDPAAYRPELSRDEQIDWAVATLPLDTSPGSTFEYSHVGYELLGRIIERVTGHPYEDSMRDDVFAPADADSFALARRTPLDDEVKYAQSGAPDAPYVTPTEWLGPGAGWVATPSDVLRVVLDLENRLSPRSIATMMKPTTAPDTDGDPAQYAKGWMVDELRGSYHTGRLSGTESLVANAHNGLAWTVVTNSSDPDHPLDLQALMSRVINALT